VPANLSPIDMHAPAIMCRNASVFVSESTMFSPFDEPKPEPDELEFDSDEIDSMSATSPAA
jgi:hypothetical protein